MAFDYITIEQAKESSGIRMVVIKGFPSPWQECAKAMLYLKGLEWSAVSLGAFREELIDWLGEASSPMMINNDSQHITSWSSILLLGEKLNPQVPLLPSDATGRATVFGICHELAGEEGLGWARRVQLTQAALNGEGGFPVQLAENLAKTYDCAEKQHYDPAKRIGDILSMLDARLAEQHSMASEYLVGDDLTAADIFWAAFSIMLDPLDEVLCELNPAMRAAFDTRDPVTWGALSQRLKDHAKMIYDRHIETPLAL